MEFREEPQLLAKAVRRTHEIQAANIFNTAFERREKRRQSLFGRVASKILGLFGKGRAK